MKNITIIVLLVASLSLSGCAGMSDTQQRTMSGAAIGTAAGGVIGAISGNTGMGMAIGAAAGAGGGYLYGSTRNPSKRPTRKATTLAVTGRPESQILQEPSIPAPLRGRGIGPGLL